MEARQPFGIAKGLGLIADEGAGGRGGKSWTLKVIMSSVRAGFGTPREMPRTAEAHVSAVDLAEVYHVLCRKPGRE